MKHAISANILQRLTCGKTVEHQEIGISEVDTCMRSLTTFLQHIKIYLSIDVSLGDDLTTITIRLYIILIRSLCHSRSPILHACDRNHVGRRVGCYHTIVGYLHLFALLTLLSCYKDDTTCCTSTIDGSRTVLQHRNILNVVWVQRAELGIADYWYTINDNQWLHAVDGRSTTQLDAQSLITRTCGSTSNGKTRYLTLQTNSHIGYWATFQHIAADGSHGTCQGSLLLCTITYHYHVIQEFVVVFHGNGKLMLIAHKHILGSISDIGNHQGRLV